MVLNFEQLKACEIISQVLTRCHNLKYLALDIIWDEPSQLNPELYQYIYRMLGQLKHLQCLRYLNLDISEINLELEGAQCLARCLQNTCNITRLYLNLRFNEIGAAGAQHIFESIGSMQKL